MSVPNWENRQVVAPLLEGVRGDLDALAAAVVACFRVEIPAYAPIATTELVPGVRSNIERAMDALDRGGEPTPGEIVASRVLGEQRAHQGVPLEALLRAHRIGVREVLAGVQERARSTGITADVVLDLANRAWAWADTVMLSAASGHREVEVTLAGQERQQRSHIMRGLLAGRWTELARSGAAAAYGITPEQRYVLVQARGPLEDLRRLEARLAAEAERGAHAFLSAELDRDLTMLAGGGVGDHVRDLPGSATIAVSDAVGLADLQAAHETIVLVLDAAAALGRRGIVALADLPLRAAILGRPDVSRVLARRYVHPLEADGEFGRVLLTSLRTWLEHGCRIEDAAAALFVHPNTMRHRLRRAQGVLQTRLDETEVRFELWWALTAEELSTVEPRPQPPG